MKLLRFRVRDFRAVKDSAWIECGQITAFVGFNESGKTTLLAALMRLADQKYGFALDPNNYKEQLFSNPKYFAGLIEDVPIDRQDEIYPYLSTTIFIEAEFTIDDDLSDLIKERFPDYKPLDTLHISKTYDGGYGMPVLFKQFEAKEDRVALVEIVLSKLPSFLYFKEVTEIPSEIDLVALALKLHTSNGKKLNQRETVFANLLSYLDIWQSNLLKSIQQIYGPFEDMEKNNITIDFNEIFKQIPMFKDRFTRGFANLTTQFVKWWGAKGMNIYYESYERGVRIRMTDEHGESFLLENRSTGFRRFFALFLAFSVSAKEDFENAILLFDEAGAALHPKMQRKLIGFFSELGKNSQIMYNTHTAYMLPVKDMNRVRIAYKDKEGHINVTSSLLSDTDNLKEESLFVSEASLAMYLAQTALVGCLPIAVLNADDMYYLQIIRNVLIARGKLETAHETLIFSAGENGIDSTTQLFSANETLPVSILPSNPSDKKVKQRLLKGTYHNEPSKLYELSDFFKEASSFIDIIPPKFIQLFGKEYLTTLLGEGFEYNKNEPLYPQVESYAAKNNIELPAKYRTYLAKSMKINTMINYKNNIKISGKLVKRWKKMMRELINLRRR